MVMNGKQQEFMVLREESSCARLDVSLRLQGLLTRPRVLMMRSLDNKVRQENQQVQENRADQENQQVQESQESDNQEPEVRDQEKLARVRRKNGLLLNQELKEPLLVEEAAEDLHVKKPSKYKK
jgi:hypothetical protein